MLRLQHTSHASRRVCFSAVLIIACLVSLSPVTWACGGFFCNANNPVNQSAERILFARDVDAGQIDMHIQIQYEGPPTDFGWILPTAPGVETTISSEALFMALDRVYGPVFQLNYDYGEGCAFPEFAADANGGGSQTEFDDGGVQVISREAIGPYDRAILQAESVADLRAWLDEQAFQIPEALDATFAPYIEAGAVFVVIKLLPGNDSGDIVPLNLSFPGTRPTIPIVPTSVAATPDMGVIVHVLDSARAIPVNYRHVQINEATIDWLSGGSNYADVVAQAVDEAGGRAFTTDYAGPHDDRLSDVLSPYSDEVLSAVAEASNVEGLNRAIGDRTNPDYQRVAASHITLPEGVSPADFFRCPNCYEEGGLIEIDGAAVAEQLRQEVNPAYERLGQALSRLPYLTRLYSTLSAEEMTLDPIFSVNPDMEEVSNIRVADVQVTCDEDGLEISSRITLADGRTYEAEDATPTQRQEGETVRGDDIPAAAVIEQTFEAGQAEELMSTPPEMMTPGEGNGGDDGGNGDNGGNGDTAGESGGGDRDGGSAADGDNEDKGCQQRSSAGSLWILLLLSTAWLTRRRAA